MRGYEKLIETCLEIIYLNHNMGWELINIENKKIIYELLIIACTIELFNGLLYCKIIEYAMI